MFGPYRMLPAGPFRPASGPRGSDVELQVTTAGGRGSWARTVHLADGASWRCPCASRWRRPPSSTAPAGTGRAGWRWSGLRRLRRRAGPGARLRGGGPGPRARRATGPGAQGGAAGHAAPRATARDTVWPGPSAATPPGATGCGCASSSTGRAGAPRLVRRPGRARGAESWRARAPGAEVPEAGRYVELAVPFALGAAVLEFPCLYRGGVGVWFDGCASRAGRARREGRRRGGVAAVCLARGSSSRGRSPRELTRPLPVGARRSPSAGPDARARRHAPALLPALALPRRAGGPDAAPHRSLPVPGEPPPREPPAGVPPLALPFTTLSLSAPTSPTTSWSSSPFRPRRSPPTRSPPPHRPPRGRRLRRRRLRPPAGPARAALRWPPGGLRARARPGGALGPRPRGHAGAGLAAGSAAAPRSSPSPCSSPSTRTCSAAPRRPGRVRASRGRRRRAPRAGARRVFGLFAAVAGAWLLLLRQAAVAGSIAEAGRGLDEVRLFSPGPGALAAPETYGGLALAGLAFVGLAAGGRRETAGFASSTGGAGLIGVLLSLGPTIPGLPLYQAVHRWAPLFAFIRNPAKLLMLVSLAGAVLAGLGARALLARVAPDSAGRRALVTAGLVVMILLATPPGTASRSRASATARSTRPSGERGPACCTCPLFRATAPIRPCYLYAVTRTRVPMVNGYSPLVPRQYVADIAEPLQPLNVGDLGPEEPTRSAGWACPTSSWTAPCSRLRRRPIRRPTRWRGYNAPVLALAQVADPLWLFRDGPASDAGVPAVDPRGRLLRGGVPESRDGHDRRRGRGLGRACRRRPPR